MKRFMPFLALAVAASATAFTGCGTQSSDIEFTADAPIYNYNELRGKNRYVYFENRKKEDYDIYKDFTEYYESDIKDKIDGGVYFLYPADGITGWENGFLEISYSMFADGIENEKYVHPIITQYMSVNDTSLTHNIPDEILDGNTPCITLEMVSGPISEFITDRDFKLEFGNNFDGVTNTYVNIYIDETCVGTCYYDENNFTVPYDWFVNYFKNNFSKEVKS